MGTKQKCWILFAKKWRKIIAENCWKVLAVYTIHDKCWIGTNSVIVGNITIGEDCLIAPLSFVNFDVPSHSIVIGNPARIIPKENATVGYINNLI